MKRALNEKRKGKRMNPPGHLRDKMKTGDIIVLEGKRAESFKKWCHMT